MKNLWKTVEPRVHCGGTDPLLRFRSPNLYYYFLDCLYILGYFGSRLERFSLLYKHYRTRAWRAGMSRVPWNRPMDFWDGGMRAFQAAPEPPQSPLLGVFPDGVADWTKFSDGALTILMHDMAAFAHAWAPLECRWEAEGAPATTLCNSVARPWVDAGRLICWVNLQTSPDCSPSRQTRGTSCS
jgi:hypothetical protein